MGLRSKKGQTLVEYILLVLVISVTVAVIIRNSNGRILELWTALASAIARPCANCADPQPPPK